MKKIIICDKNKALISQLKRAIGTGPHPSGVEIKFVCGDIITLHEKTPNSRIVTASNPSFTPDGGLDAVLAKKYVWNNPTEFMCDDNLFYVKSVDEDRSATKAIVERALVGVLGHAGKHTMLLTGIGTGVGGLAVNVLEVLIKKVLSSADLRHANLRSANLSFSDFTFADLRYANFSFANLRFSNLSSANLRFVNLSYADLSYVNLRFSNLSYADFRFVNLSFSDFTFADLRYANFSFANLHFSNLSYANLRYVKSIKGVKHNEGTAFFALSCPSDGAFIGWKKANGCIVKLQITEKAKRSSATTRKCRCSEAKVLAIYDGKKSIKKVASHYDVDVVYKVGKIVKPKGKFDEDRWNECSSGIHFFITREEAEQWIE